MVITNGKFIILRCPKIRANYSLIIMCSNIGTPNNHYFPIGTNGNVVVLGVPVLKHFRVFQSAHQLRPICIFAFRILDWYDSQIMYVKREDS